MYDFKNAGDDLLSPWTDYHRPRVLNGRVRNGNGCGHSGVVTGKFRCVLSRLGVWCLCVTCPCVPGVLPGERDGVVKRSAVSTG